MHLNFKKEKCDINILSENLETRNKFISKSTSVLRPDSLEIQLKPDSIVNMISKADTYIENVNSWGGDGLDNFIIQIKNANNTPSPITPNSFFNPPDVTQDQEQFADALTLHLNKIKEDYKSSNETNDSHYLNNFIQISSYNQEKPIPIATVSLGNKLFLLNQITHNLDSNDNQCINYGVTDLPGNISMSNDNSGTFVQQPLKISHFQNLLPGSSLQFTSYNQRDCSDLSQLISLNSDTNIVNQQPQQNKFKTSENVIYSCVSDSSQNRLLNQLNCITSNVSHAIPNITQMNPNVIKSTISIDRDPNYLSTSSNDNDTNDYDTNTSSVKTEIKDCSNNNIKQLPMDERDLDEGQRRLERKRARNRDAARKCRDRKNSLISTLEQKYTRQMAEKDLIREKLLKSLEEIRRLTEFISKHDPHSKFANFSNFLSEIKIHELTEADLKDLNLM